MNGQRGVAELTADGAIRLLDLILQSLRAERAKRGVAVLQWSGDAPLARAPLVNRAAQDIDHLPIQATLFFLRPRNQSLPDILW